VNVDCVVECHQLRMPSCSERCNLLQSSERSEFKPHRSAASRKGRMSPHSCPGTLGGGTEPCGTALARATRRGALGEQQKRERRELARLELKKELTRARCRSIAHAQANSLLMLLWALLHTSREKLNERQRGRQACPGPQARLQAARSHVGRSSLRKTCTVRYRCLQIVYNATDPTAWARRPSSSPPRPSP
jgi:hypothetical protein